MTVVSTFKWLKLFTIEISFLLEFSEVLADSLFLLFPNPNPEAPLMVMFIASNDESGPFLEILVDVFDSKSEVSSLDTLVFYPISFIRFWMFFANSSLKTLFVSTTFSI